MNKENKKEMLERIVLTSRGRSLEDNELLGLTICSGNQIEKSINIAEKLIHVFGSIGAAISSDYKQLINVDPSMSSATVSRIFCIKETLERTLKGELKDQPIIDSQDKIVDYFRVAIGQSRTESLRVLYLDSNYRLVHEYIKDSINPSYGLTKEKRRGNRGFFAFHGV